MFWAWAREIREMNNMISDKPKKAVLSWGDLLNVMFWISFLQFAVVMTWNISFVGDGRKEN